MLNCRHHYHKKEIDLYAILFVENDIANIYTIEDFDLDENGNASIELFDELTPSSTYDSSLFVENGEMVLIRLDILADDSIVPVKLMKPVQVDSVQLSSHSYLHQLANKLLAHYKRCGERMSKDLQAIAI